MFHSFIPSIQNLSIQPYIFGINLVRRCSKKSIKERIVLGNFWPAFLWILIYYDVGQKLAWMVQMVEQDTVHFIFKMYPYTSYYPQKNN